MAQVLQPLTQVRCAALPASTRRTDSKANEAPKGGRVGVTYVSLTPSTSAPAVEPKRQRRLHTRGAVARAAVKEAHAVSTEAAAAALEAAFREPSFGLDDVLALSDELEVVGPPPDWTEGSAPVSTASLVRVPHHQDLDTVRRGLDDVFEMSGDLDLLGPSPDDTSGFEDLRKSEFDGQDAFSRLEIEGAEALEDRTVSEAGVVEGTSHSVDVSLGMTPVQLASRSGENVGSADSQISLKPPRRRLASKALDLVPVKSLNLRQKRGDRKLVRRRVSREGDLKSPAQTDGLSSAPALRAVYQEGIENIGSRTGQINLRSLTSFVNEWKVLTLAEERKLGLVIQRSKALQAMKSEIEGASGAPVSEEQWAKAAGVSVGVLQRQLAAGMDAKQRLVECNLRLVTFVAHRMRNYPNALPLEDLFLAGIQGLLIAAERFDPNMGYRFSTYVVHSIRSQIQRTIRSLGTLIRLPVYKTGKINLRKVQEELGHKLGRLPTTEEMAEHKNLSVDFMKDILKWHRGMDVVTDDFSEGWDKYTPPEYGQEGALVSLDAQFLESDLDFCVSTLPEKEREVLKRRYGLGGQPLMTLRDIGDSLGISYEMVRRYEARGMILMRKSQRTERLADYRPMVGGKAW